MARYDEDSTGAGVAADGFDTGVFTGTSAPGGRRGSVAIVTPSCNIGAGAGTLDGGEEQETLLCPSAAVAAATRHPTTWRVSGVLAGTSTYRTRLIVINN